MVYAFGMSKHREIIATLTEAEKAALRTAKTGHIGKVAAAPGTDVFRSLRHMGLVGAAGGTTVTGSCVADILIRDQEEELFPL